MAARKKTPQVQETQFDKVQALLKMAEGLSPGERAKLAAQGLFVPEKVDTETRFGIRCVHCNEVAVYLGDEEGITDLEGNHIEASSDPESRPDGISLKQWAWFWNGEGRFNPIKPSCQHCGGSVRVLNKHIPGKLLVEIAPWREAREEAMKEQKASRRTNQWGVARSQKLTDNIQIDAGTVGRINDSMPLDFGTAGKVLEGLAETLDSRGISLSSALRQSAPSSRSLGANAGQEPAPELQGRKSFIQL